MGQKDNCGNYNPTTKSQIKKRTKKCPWCEVNFCDITNRNISNCCCKDHSSRLMVATRKRKGSYTRTAEQNKTISIALKKSWSDKKWKPKRCSKCGQPNLFRYNQTGVCWECRKKPDRYCVDCNRKLYKYHDSPYCFICGHNGKNNGKNFYREDIGLYCRSTWEANFARVLNYLNITFEYEQKSFEVIVDNKVRHYTPDFFINGKTFVELKGYWREDNKKKFDEFLKQHPTISIKVIGPKEYCRMLDKWKQKVNNLENVENVERYRNNV